MHSAFRRPQSAYAPTSICQPPGPQCNIPAGGEPVEPRCNPTDDQPNCADKTIGTWEKDRSDSTTPKASFQPAIPGEINDPYSSVIVVILLVIPFRLPETD